MQMKLHGNQELSANDHSKSGLYVLSTKIILKTIRYSNSGDFAQYHTTNLRAERKILEPQHYLGIYPKKLQLN
ncbi:hypothetical protein CDL12_03826 [Handroanthus impetiginosus]|uniref:Uncharacterized protein n=1 Tax=Handroanthus impetiginosus TaxID=429701 RepID=A0A2G9I1G8_9LAMI|nr:hypothetical protein CDL12_03826 [Handroanthus impetiginosus]